MLPSAPARYEPAPAIRTSETGCSCGVRPSEAPGANRGQMAFPIGRIFYDFGKEARLDYFVQAIANWRDSLSGRGDPIFGPDRDRSGDTAAPYNPAIMARYLLNQAQGEMSTPAGLGSNFPDADAIYWTLTIDSIPIYVIKPLDVFGLGFFAALILALWHQEVSHEDPAHTRMAAADAGAEPPAPRDAFPPRGGVARVSMAGWVDSTNTTKLLNGTIVPTLVTDWRGFYQWDLYSLFGPEPNEWPAGAEGFLERIYNEFRNVGISPQDRALNYSAMNAYNTKKIFLDVASKEMRLDTVEIDRSVICRPDSDCWDVTYRFFNPTQLTTSPTRIIGATTIVPIAVSCPQSISVCVTSCEAAIGSVCEHELDPDSELSLGIGEADADEAEVVPGLDADAASCSLPSAGGHAPAVTGLALAARVRDGLRVRGVATSEQTARFARELGIELVGLEAEIELTVDGADEVDGRLDLIKGHGGALVRERIVAVASRRQIILVTSEKLVETLGTRGPLPVEVMPFAVPFCRRRLEDLELKPTLRMQDERPFVTDNFNVIFDCDTGPIADPALKSASWPTFTTLNVSRNLPLVKPRLGRRRKSGIWPPS